MTDFKATDVERFNAPYGKEVAIEEVDYENGFKMLRMRIREAKRFTTVDLDPVTAAHWGKILVDWAAAQPTDSASADRVDGADADGE